MTANGWIQIAVFALIILALTKPIGLYLHRVLEEGKLPLAKVTAPIDRLLLALVGGTKQEQSWKQYAGAMLAFSAVGVLVAYAIQRLQPYLPWNPQALAAPSEHLAFNTAASFTTNTNWQSYGGESTMSYFTQAAALAWHNFVSAATGIGVALAVARGLTRRPGPDGAETLGNFWVDLVRTTFFVLVPASFLLALFLVSQGVIQNLAPYVEAQTVEGGKQLLAMGPAASQLAIKMIGTNGGGFFNANSAHPFENPTPLVNLVEMLCIFAISAGLTFTYGKMARDQRQGWAIFGAMAALFLAGVAVCYHAEAAGNPVLAMDGLQAPAAGNWEGKEARFGMAPSALFATITTDASCGAVNSMHDSFTPLGGLVPLVNIQLGEVIFGGVGAGLYGILVMVILTVFLAGLMVGRTPEYLGKKVEAREVKLAVLYCLIFPLAILAFGGAASVLEVGTSSLNNAGPHGLSEILYAYSSGTGNNGSAFAGLNANTPWWDWTLAAAMLIGRFLMIVPALALAGSMVGKKVVPAGSGTFPTDGWLFTGLLVSVVLIVGALTFFPALALGPIVEHFLAGAAQVY